MHILDTFLENASEPMYAITLIISLVKFPKYFSTPLKYFPILLMYTLLTEVLGHITRNYEVYDIAIFSSYVSYNVIIYNIYNIIFFSYFFFVYWRYIHKPSYKNIIVAGGSLFLILSAINPFFQDFKLEAQMYSYLSGAFIMILCIVLFFLDYRNAKDKLDFRYTGIKWISIGLFIFYAGYFPIKASRYQSYLSLYTEYIHLRRIHLILILVSYICFIIGFVRMKKKFWI